MSPSLRNVGQTERLKNPKSMIHMLYSTGVKALHLFKAAYMGVFSLPFWLFSSCINRLPPNIHPICRSSSSIIAYARLMFSSNRQQTVQVFCQNT